MEQNWTTTIKPKSNLLELRLKDLWQYKDLIKMFILRDFVTFYKQTILGPLWFIIQPVFTAGMFSIVFGTLAKISTDETPQMLFYLSGIINWTYFSESLTKTSDTFIANTGIFGKVYFPRLTVPVAAIITNMLRYFIQFAIFLIIYFMYIFKGANVHPNYLIALTPVLLVYLALMSLGFGIWVSSLTTKYRDLKFALPFLVQLWMYASPVVYPFSLIPEKYKFIAAINPIVPVIEIFRYSYLGAGTVNINHIIISICFTMFILITGVIIFNRIEKKFMDTV
jgi:lipopolysaccharide transport system permease protein